MGGNEAALTCDSVTKLGPEARGRIVLAASHAGRIAASMAAAARVRALVLSDAGIGRERAGVAGLDLLQALGMAAAACSHRSARIGDGADMLARGTISEANDCARAMGVVPGQTVRDALRRFDTAPMWHGPADALSESRVTLEADDPAIHVLDSVSLVRASDAGSIVATGSHGGLLGGQPATALRVDAFAALYNDADNGIDGAGTTRLPALDARNIAACTVSAWSARIGDGRSTLDDGFVTHQNQRAAALGGTIGIPARQWVARMRDAARKGL